MIDQLKRVDGVVKGHLKQLALGQTCGHAVSFGTVFAPEPGQPPETAHLQTGWQVLVSIPQPIPNLGQAKDMQSDIAVSLPIGGVLPPDAVFKQAVELLWEAIQQVREKKLRQTAQSIPQQGMDLTGIQS